MLIIFYHSFSLQIFNDKKWTRRRRLKREQTKAAKQSADNCNMGLHKNYLKVGQNASNQIFGIPRVHRGSTPLSMLISYGAKFNSSKYYHIDARNKYTSVAMMPQNYFLWDFNYHFVCSTMLSIFDDVAVERKKAEYVTI